MFPHGYKNNQDGKLMIYEEQAIVVRQIFELYLSGYSVDMIMEELADKNIYSPTGKEIWSKRTIQTMLTNESKRLITEYISILPY